MPLKQKIHQVISILQEIFNLIPDKNPAIVLKDVSYFHLQQMMQYIYCGAVTIPADQVDDFKKVLHSMKIEFVQEDDEIPEENESSAKKTSEDNTEQPEMLMPSDDESDDVDVDDLNWNETKIKDEPKSDEDSSDSFTTMFNISKYAPTKNPRHAAVASSSISNSNLHSIKLLTHPEGKISMDRVVPSKKMQRYMTEHPLICPFCEKRFKTTKHR
jgi:hypothetical protein